MKKMDEAGEIWFGENGDQIPSRKSFLCDVKNGVTAVTIWPYDEVGHNHEANNELKDLGLGGIFNNPKPTRLIERIITLAEKDKNSIILDFFAGSGTTAHAVLKKNKEDGGNRRFILIQLPELVDPKSSAFASGFKHISDFTAARISKVCNDYSSSYKHFKLDETNIRCWDADFENLEKVLQQSTKSIKDGRSNEDVLYEIILKYGYDLSTPIDIEIIHNKVIFVVDAGSLIVCLDDEITTEIVEGIAKLKDKLGSETTQVVFKDEGFTDDRVKTNAIQILKQAAIEDVKSIQRIIMSEMKIKFNPKLAHQREAINSVLGIFDGQETFQSNFSFLSNALTNEQLDLFARNNDIGIANALNLLPKELYENTRNVQLINGLPQTETSEQVLPSLDFTIEMETGTGKTYVYLRSIFELNQHYGLTKFIIVVPSVAIKEGVY